ncbi:glycosyltransferase family 1 protein [Cryobacterium sp. TmT2-59]|uniref:glycosyltransferase family 4 protein n=1 Tax=Cryobacterium sp. TmT2-59 TaxID=1259264 RepID=UPI00106D8D18|nr:glycosyltransferase family 4 protein [Cryobacterium sp. TmT2-59]TFC89817.1 glycosyltransferase family 1 protein [Cryobacterium sp. TmT2-59]
MVSVRTSNEIGKLTDKPKILLGVTADESIVLMRGFAEHLSGTGWDVHVVSSPGPRSESLSKSAGLTVHTIPMNRNPSPFADAKALLAWICLLRAVSPDVISVGTPKAGLLGGIAGLIARVPTRIYLLRGLRLETAYGLQRLVLTIVEMCSMAVSHRVLAVSSSLRQRAIDLRLVGQAKVIVLGVGSSNGVDMGAHERSNFSEEELHTLSRSLGLLTNIPVVGFVGRLTKDKGLDVLTAARLIMATKGERFQLLVVGEVDDKGGADVLSELSQSTLPSIVTGYVSHPAIYFQLMDVLCLPTLREGFPNVVLEAAASGVPSVTTSATGAIDSVIDGETGLIARVSSAPDLADCLTRMISDSTRCKDMGARARAHVSANYARPLVWANTQRFYMDYHLERKRIDR